MRRELPAESSYEKYEPAYKRIRRGATCDSDGPMRVVEKEPDPHWDSDSDGDAWDSVYQRAPPVLPAASPVKNTSYDREWVVERDAGETGSVLATNSRPVCGQFQHWGSCRQANCAFLHVTADGRVVN